MNVKVQIWDWPLRLFHWLLVLAVTGAYVSGELGGSLTDWHGRLGSLTLGLLVFRLVWGFIGPKYARFANFFPTLSGLKSYIKGDWRGAGHNPAGALAVLALLTVLGWLVVTGLFANDDIAFEGPLFHLVDKDLSDKLSGWHKRAELPLLLLVGLHVGAIGYYRLVKKVDLLRPMLTGEKQFIKAQAPRPMRGVSPPRFLFSLLIAVLAVWAIQI
ncbi:MAG: cytochrome b/b6 domain-containing protein [Methylococcales bacterium]|nr:cytochrome b/b6 domain-containing protein [Methylococcales bacterium]